MERLETALDMHKTPLREQTPQRALTRPADPGSKRPPDSPDGQAEIYARELRRLFLETRRLSRQLVEVTKAHDDEREWIALDVHDRIAQTLASIFQQLQAMEGLARSTPEIRRAAVRGALLCREAIREARNIMNDLRPPILDELGLIPTIEEELTQFGEETSCTVVRVLALPVGGLSRPVELTLYRIFRESIVNIRKHARASLVEVSLATDTTDTGGIRLEITDDGAGFDPGDAIVKKPVGGLLSMRRRAELAGGTLRLDSRPGVGTRVSAWIPQSPARR